METLIINIQKRIPELSYSQVEQIFYFLVVEKINTLAELIKKTGIPNTTIKEVIASTSGAVVLNGDKLVLTQELENSKFENTKQYTAFIDEELTNKIKEIRTKYNLNPKRELDQFFATEETTVKKALVIENYGLVKNTKIAILGDDDFVSIALALKYKNLINITVFETDLELINKIKEVSKDYDLKINLVEYNAKEEVPNIYKNQFNLVLTDPPYTENGIELFLDRGLSLITHYGYVFINYGNSLKTPEKYIRIQEIFNKYSLLIKNVFYNFNVYNGASSIGSNSSLYVLQATKLTTPSGVTFENIYTFEDRDLLKFPYSATFSYKLTQVPTTILYSRAKIDEIAKKFAKAHTLKIVDESITKFNNTGFTFNYTLSASSLVIHTWPEYKAMHILIDVCSKIKNEMLMIETLSKLFETDIKNISFKKYL